MDEPYNIRQAANAAGLTRSQLEQWISRGWIRPADEPRPGTARRFSLTEVIEIAVRAELARMGLPIDRGSLVSQAVGYLHGFKDAPAILVMWQGPIDLNGRSIDEHGRPKSQPRRMYYDPDHPPFGADIVRPHELANLILDPDKRALVAVNLDEIEARVKASLSASAE